MDGRTRRADAGLSSKYRNINDKYSRPNTTKHLRTQLLKCIFVSNITRQWKQQTAGIDMQVSVKLLGRTYFKSTKLTGLVVGAGGIGCGVEKPSYGRFCRHRVIDLDTIDVST